MSTYLAAAALRRRHLNESQRAMVAAKLANLGEGRPAKTPSIDGVSQPKAASLLNVSAKSVERAAAVRASGAPSLSSAVERGEVSVSAAAELAAAALAALLPGEVRVATPDLLARLRPSFPALRAEALGKTLASAGWRPAQWRAGGGRVRGYLPPADRSVAAGPANSATTDDTAPEIRAASAAFLAASRGACVSPGPHAGSSPPALPCRCGSHRWWRSRLRSPGWCCFCAGSPMPAEPIVVVER